MQTKFGMTGMRCALCAMLMAGSLLIAQDKKGDTKGTAPAAAKGKSRLPSNFGKLNLADDQKTKIYGIQASFDPKIDELEAQLKVLKDKEQAEVEAVLTPEQSKQLATLKAEAKKKKADDAKAAAKAKPADVPVTVEPAKKTTPEKKP
jgi:hypothetical protein